MRLMHKWHKPAGVLAGDPQRVRTNWRTFNTEKWQNDRAGAASTPRHSQRTSWRNLIAGHCHLKGAAVLIWKGFLFKCGSQLKGGKAREEGKRGKEERKRRREVNKWSDRATLWLLFAGLGAIVCRPLENALSCSWSLGWLLQRWCASKFPRELFKGQACFGFSLETAICYLSTSKFWFSVRLGWCLSPRF